VKVEKRSKKEEVWIRGWEGIPYVRKTKIRKQKKIKSAWSPVALVFVSPHHEMCFDYAAISSKPTWGQCLRNLKRRKTML